MANEIKCECNCIHKDVIEEVKTKIPEGELLITLAGFLKMFGDFTRIKILLALVETELCVCDISALLNLNQSAISHQLRLLRQSNLVKYRRKGKVVYYSLADEHVKAILDIGMEHIL